MTPVAWTLLLWSGFTATLAVTWLDGVACAYGLTRLRAPRLLGCLVVERPRWLGASAGLLLHFLLGTLAFPAAYAVVFTRLGRADAGMGMLLGGIHGLAAGASLPWLARAGRCSPEGGPGLFGRRLGVATPLGIVLAHIVYGGLLGYVYVVPA